MVGLCCAVATACTSDPPSHPGIVGPGGGGGLGGGGGDDDDTDAGGFDAAVPTGRDVEGTVVLLDDLSLSPDRFAPVEGRLVTGLDGRGTVITDTSGADGSFSLPGIDFDTTASLTVGGDPSSTDLIDAGRSASAIAPVVARDFLEQVALSVDLAPDDFSGHAFVWLEDDRGLPLSGISATVDSVSPVRGPFYGTADATQLAEVGPTVDTGLLVLLDGLPDTYVITAFRAADPGTTVSIPIELEAGVVTFFEAMIRL
jgi:hypothetical protein